MVVFLAFVMSLQEGLYREQFRVLGWAAVINVMVVVPGGSLYALLFRGVGWFALAVGLPPVSRLAYRLAHSATNSRLLGFLTALGSTIALSQLLCGAIQDSQRMVCPQPALSLTPFSYTDCVIPDMFRPLPRDFLGQAVIVS